MDFFAAEQRAKKRTTRLLVLFGFAVAGTIAAGYVATVFALRASAHSGYGRYRSPKSAAKYPASTVPATARAKRTSRCWVFFFARPSAAKKSIS